MADDIAPTREQRLADGGPRYKETPLNPLALDSRIPAEPWNTVTAAIFILIVVYWARKVWNNWRNYPFIVCCLPILLAGGIGGTLYHALRSQKAYFLLDLIPIIILGVLGSLYMISRLAKELGWMRVGFISLGLMTLFIVINGVFFSLIQFPNPNWRVNLSYGTQAILILLPIAAVLVRTGFKHGSWVLIALISFAQAWFCRLVDNTGWDGLPMGTHWLWHIFGAITTHTLTFYFYKVEGLSVLKPAPEPLNPGPYE
jgi:hypothetical protein